MNCRTIHDQRYTSGSDNVLCQPEEDNEIEDDEERSARASFPSAASSSSNVPIVSVLHDTGYRTVLTALPATFGLRIQNDTEVGLEEERVSSLAWSYSHRFKS